MFFSFSSASGATSSEFTSGWGPAAHYQHLSFKKSHYEEIEPIVKPGEIRVSTKQLYTAGLLTCVALGFTDGKQNFLAHVMSTSSVTALKEAIQRKFDVAALKSKADFSILMWCGADNSKFAKSIVEQAIQEIGLFTKLIDMTSMDEVGLMTEVGVDITGTFCEETRPLESDGKLTVIKKNSYPVMFQDGKIHPAVVDLSKLFAKEAALTLDNLPPGSAGDLETWNAWLQKYFLRPATADHQDIATLAKHPLHHQMMPFFKSLGLLDAVMPSQKYYDVIAIFGGTPNDTRERMYHVVKLWEQGIRADRIIYINGRRPLHALELAQHGLDTENKDTPSQPDWVPPKDIPTFQHEMAALIWNQLVPQSSDLYSRFQILTIDPPLGKKRATTEDTIAALVEQNPTMKSCLFISNAPYGPYQSETMRNVFDERGLQHLLGETSSSGLTRDLTTAPFLDTLARRVYTAREIELRHQSRKKVALYKQ